MSIEEEDEFNGEQGFSCQYINLDKRLDRRKLMQAEMKAQGLKGQRFSAKMGDDVKDSLVTWQWHSKLNCLYDKKTLPALHDMSKGERGCSGSHIALWKQCLRRNDPSKPMLILEDDAVLWERSGVKFPELTQRLIDAVEQVRVGAVLARVRVAGRRGGEGGQGEGWRSPLACARQMPGWHSPLATLALATLALATFALATLALGHADRQCLRPLSRAPQCWDVENTPVILYVGCEVVQWRDSRRVVVEGPPVMKLREAEYLWQTSSYIIWPAAAKELLAHLPIDCPTDCYISKLVLEGFVTAVVASPCLVEQRDPYAKGDIKHTNVYKWDVQK